MSEIKKEYIKDDLVVTWQPSRCTHSTNCWRGLIAVFNPKNKPWINMEGADESQIKAQVDKCPSAALGYKVSE